MLSEKLRLLFQFSLSLLLTELQVIVNYAEDLSWCSTKPFQYGVHLAKTTYLSSPKMSRKVHCIFFARTYSSWSTTTQEIWFGLMYSVVSFTSFIPSRIISGVAAFSWKRGRMDSMHISGCPTASDLAEWNEDHMTGLIFMHQIPYIGCRILRSSMPFHAASRHQMNSLPLDVYRKREVG